MEKRSYNVFSNFLWRFAERCGAQIVQLFVSILLARVLMPEDYGTIALVLVFAQVLQVFVDSGLGNALIQKKDADDLDFSSVFYFNIVICLILYSLVYMLAPFIAAFFNNFDLISIIRVLCLTIVISSLKNVQQAFVSKNLLFKKFFFATLAGTLASAIVGIYLASVGKGVWALVAQKLVNLTIDTIALWLLVKWRPKKMFSFNRLKKLLKYGWKLLISSLIDTTYNNVRSLVIGRIYSEAALAFYNQGDQFPKVIVTNINTSIDSILFPIMAREQDDKVHVKNMTRRAIKISTYIMAPLMMGLAFTAPQIVEIVLTEKWLPSVPFLRIFCVTYLFYPIHTSNLNAIKAMGRSDLFLKLEIIKKCMGITLLYITARQGVMAIAYSMIVSSVLSQIINSWPNRRLLDYKYWEQIRDIFPSTILAVVMGITVSFVSFLNMNTFLTIIIQILLGIVIYIVGSILLKIDSFYYLLNLLSSFMDRNKRIRR